MAFDHRGNPMDDPYLNKRKRSKPGYESWKHRKPMGKRKPYDPTDGQGWGNGDVYDEYGPFE